MRVAWTAVEEQTLLDVVKACESSHNHRGHTIKGHNWNKISRIVSEQHGYYRTPQACKCRLAELKKRGVEA